MFSYEFTLKSRIDQKSPGPTRLENEDSKCWEIWLLMKIEHEYMVLWCVMTITIINVLFTPTIVSVRFKTNIPPGYTPKPHKNKFNNYSIFC